VANFVDINNLVKIVQNLKNLQQPTEFFISMKASPANKAIADFTKLCSDDESTQEHKRRIL